MNHCLGVVSRLKLRLISGLQSHIPNCHFSLRRMRQCHPITFSRYKKGGVASGFKHVETNKYDVRRLLHVKVSACFLIPLMVIFVYLSKKVVQIIPFGRRNYPNSVQSHNFSQAFQFAVSVNFSFYIQHLSLSNFVQLHLLLVDNYFVMTKLIQIRVRI